MSKAYKCDLCGCLFDPHDYPNEQFVKCSDVWVVPGRTYETGMATIKHMNDANLYVMCSKRFIKKEEQCDEKTDNSKSAAGTLYDIIDSIFLGGSKRAGKSDDSICDSETSERKSDPIEESKD